MKKLSKSSTDSMFFGVAGGLGEYFEIDSTIIRFLFAITTIFGGGSGLLLYIILAIIMPQPNNHSKRNHTSTQAKKDDNWSDF